tara:strand:+ start:146 stop:901 length:756 start_codon:yes stop_codon:yes gene_type:complete
MINRTKLFEGKAKIIFEGDQPNTLIQYFKDDATAFNNKKKSKIIGKGKINNLISEFLMKKISKLKIKTHLIKRISMREQIIHKLQIIPLEVVLRNFAAGSIVKRLGINEGKKFKKPIIEFYLKNDQLEDPFVSQEHIEVFEWASQNEMKKIISISHKINKYLLNFFLMKNIKLVDFKLEFGRSLEDNKEIIVADEISPDNCRLWDLKTNRKLDKDRFRQNLGDVKEAYLEVANRLGVLPIKEPKEEVLNEI